MILLSILCRRFGWHRWRPVTQSIAQDGTLTTRSRCLRCDGERTTVVQDDRYRWGAGRYPI